MQKILLFILMVISCGCGKVSHNQSSVFVSIEPLRWVVNSLTDSTISVNVLVPGATSPETYEPTARQTTELEHATLYICTGLLGFEQELQDRIASTGCDVVDVSGGLQLLEGVCNHDHHNHNHSVDPHIWLSTTTMRGIIANCAKALEDKGMLGNGKLDSLLRVVDSVDNYIRTLKGRSTVEAFAIVHPSLTYFATDYSLHQIALEFEGKEPSMRSIKASLDELIGRGLNSILYSSHDSDAVAQVVSEQMSLKMIPFEPLSYDWVAVMTKVAEDIYGTSQSR